MGINARPRMQTFTNNHRRAEGGRGEVGEEREEGEEGQRERNVHLDFLLLRQES